VWLVQDQRNGDVLLVLLTHALFRSLPLHGDRGPLSRYMKAQLQLIVDRTLLLVHLTRSRRTFRYM